MEFRSERSLLNYDGAETWCMKIVNGHDLLFDVDVFDIEMRKACKQFHFPTESLNSFLRNIHLKKVKKQTHSIKSKLNNQIIPEYVKGKSIISLAKQYNFPPALLSRSIIEKVSTLPKKKISDAMKNPHKLNEANIIAEDFLSSEQSKDGKSKASKKRIYDPFSGEEILKDLENMTRLAFEVQEAISLDPLYGPRSDRERQIIGKEYEIILEQTLRSMNIPFETEQELKKKGTSKTPDILLSCPVGVKIPKPKSPGSFEWKMICWIDSKALFGDISTHQKSVLPQAEGYVHRFGPGLVLYWFGHAPYDQLDHGHGDVVVTAWNVPKELMLPTGEITSVGCVKNL